MKRKTYWYFKHQGFLICDPKFRVMLAQANGDTLVVILIQIYEVLTPGRGTISISGYNITDCINKLAQMINRELNIVQAALSYYEKNGLIVIEQVQNDEETPYDEITVVIVAPYVQMNVGRSSSESDKKRLEYQKMKEEEESKLLLRDPEEKQAYGKFQNVCLTQDEYDSFKSEYINADELIFHLSIYKKSRQIEYASDYAMLLKFAASDGILQISEKDRNERLFNKLLQEVKAVGVIPDEAYEKLSREQIYELIEASRRYNGEKDP